MYLNGALTTCSLATHHYFTLLRTRFRGGLSPFSGTSLSIVIR